MKMKTKILILCVTVITLFTGCARWNNSVEADGSIFGSTNGDWIVIKQSGGQITDVWKLENQFVQSEQGSDGWLFVDHDNNPVHVGGDMKAIRINNKKEDIFNTYIEYHMEHDTLTYAQRYKLKNNR